MSRTFGAPFGASMDLGKSGVDSLAVRPILPWNGGCGRGRTFESPAGGCSWANKLLSRPEAASPPRTAPITSATIACKRVLRSMKHLPFKMKDHHTQIDHENSRKE